MTLAHFVGLTPHSSLQVRCFALERDSQFVYLALERCECALADAVEPSVGSAQPASQLQLLSPEGKAPSARAWAIAKDIGSGLLFLHERGFVHRDLKVRRASLSTLQCHLFARA
jgi:serine/threonine-protein kinase/endoribonuclease IRE1